MTDQPGLFDPVAEGAARRDDGIDRAQQHAPPDWYDLAHRAVRSVATLANTFTTDDVWSWLDDAGAPPPPEPRAMGAVMRDARKSGIAIPTDRTRLSTRPACHRRPVRVWQQTYDASTPRGADPDGR